MRKWTLAVFLAAVVSWASAQTASTTANAIRITNGPVVEYADDSLAVVYWTTNLPATSTVHFGTDPQELDHVAAGATAQTQHRVNIADLSPSTRYYFVAESADPSGNGFPARSIAATVTTVAAGQPAIQNRQASPVAGTVPAAGTNAPAAPASGATQSSPATNSSASTASTPTPTPPTSNAPVTQTSDQTTTEQSAARSNSSRELPAGTQIEASLDQALSTKNAQVGDDFSATVTQPVRSSNGTVLIPTGSKINGKVSESEQGKTLPAIRGRGRLNVRFVDITFPEHVSAPLLATLVSVHPKGGNGKTGSEGEITSGTSGKDTVKDVGIGAGVGTVAGLIFGSALKGLAIGAIAGGGYVLATNGKDVELPAQTELTVRLDQNLIVPASAMEQASGGTSSEVRSPAPH